MLNVCSLITALATSIAGQVSPSSPSPSRPNIVVILADDLGFSDLGCYGGEIKTPNLDRLAADGLRFTQFYNTARCWPSRAALLTGYYAQQVRRDTVPGVPSGARGTRPKWAKLLPQMLRPLGYRSYHSGKWHVDGMPLADGFDHSYYLEDCRTIFPPASLLPRMTVSCRRSSPASGYYATNAIAEHGIDFLADHAAKHRSEPFFLYLAFNVAAFSAPGSRGRHRPLPRSLPRRLGVDSRATAQAHSSIWAS